MGRVFARQQPFAEQALGPLNARELLERAALRNQQVPNQLGLVDQVKIAASQLQMRSQPLRIGEVREKA